MKKPTIEDQFKPFLKNRAAQYDMEQDKFREDWHKDWKRFIEILNEDGYYITKEHYGE